MFLYQLFFYIKWGFLKESDVNALCE